MIDDKRLEMIIASMSPHGKRLYALFKTCLIKRVMDEFERVRWTIANINSYSKKAKRMRALVRKGVKNMFDF